MEAFIFWAAGKYVWLITWFVLAMTLALDSQLRRFLLFSGLSDEVWLPGLKQGF